MAPCVAALSAPRYYLSSLCSKGIMFAKLARGLTRKALHARGYDIVRVRSTFDFTPEETRIIEAVKAHTMTGPERIVTMIRAVDYAHRYGLPGAIVECGVWRGGSIMAAILALRRLGVEDRELYLYDTFEGMPQPSAWDVRHDGVQAMTQFLKLRSQEDRAAWCAATLEDVRGSIQPLGYRADKIHYVKGKVEETIPSIIPEQIAILRLDTDWYESTRHELEHLYPRLVPGGLMIIDDYGYWQGARRATDEYFQRTGERIFLSRIDATARIAVKQPSHTGDLAPRR